MKQIYLKISIGYPWSKKEASKDPRWIFLRDICKKMKGSIEKLSNEDFNIQVDVARIRSIHGGLILPDILRRIKESNVMLFDIGEDNHNVYLELGAALSTHEDFRNVFILAKHGQEPPSDLQGFLYSFYEEMAEYSLVDSKGFYAALRSALLRALREKGFLAPNEEEEAID